VVCLALKDLNDLGDQFFTWEMATVVAGQRLSINLFDQPNVESAKILARQMVAAYQESGTLPELATATLSADSLANFMQQAKAGDYVAIQAYVQPTPATDQALNALRLALRNRYRLATTVGYGPRFLHSTGQLHKGDGGNGLFIQFTSDATQDLPIPDAAGKTESAISFDVLKHAQALGDVQSLKSSNRRLSRFQLGKDVVGGLHTVRGK